MNICVFCSAQEVPPKYNEAAKELGECIAKGSHVLVWGGSNRGVMKTIADSVQKHGGKLIGISMEPVKHKAREGADEMIIEKDLASRKTTMLDRSDAFVALAGGFGTLDEVSEVIALKRHGTHSKPVVLLNTDGFYAGLKEQLTKMEKEGFLGDTDKDVINGLDTVAHFANTPEETLEFIEKHC